MLIVSEPILREPGGDRGLAGGRLTRAGLEHLAHEHVLDACLRCRRGRSRRGWRALRARAQRDPETAAELPERRPNGRDDHRPGHARPSHNAPVQSDRGAALALVLAGGEGGRLDVLTAERAEAGAALRRRLPPHRLPALAPPSQPSDVWVLQYEPHLRSASISRRAAVGSGSDLRWAPGSPHHTGDDESGWYEGKRRRHLPEPGAHRRAGSRGAARPLGRPRLPARLLRGRRRPSQVGAQPSRS